MMLATLAKPSCRLSMLVVLVVLLFFTGGCTGKNNTGSPQGGNGNIAGSGGYEIVDSTGYVLQLPQKPQKIVPLSVSTDEILLALVTPERIAALTHLVDDAGVSNVVEEAKVVPKRIRIHAESIIALQPDLVLMPDWLPPVLSQTLRETGIPVYVYKTAANVDEVKQSIIALARVVGEEQAGERLVAEMETQLAQINEKTSTIPADKRPVVIRFSLMGDSGGKGSTFEDICRQAGAIEGVAAAGLNNDDLLSKEQLVRINPDIILLPVWDYTGKTDIQKFAEDVQNDPALQIVKAIQNKKMIVVPDRHLTSTSQYIVYGVQAVARAAYPQLF
ncbi:ABC transporter substrate-binding protein [Sporomusa sphaeroides]|uniref:Corrinoid ABC transporter substrate-binding protein n=1 Tax=Sporomusa sphaeroides DSM 2875 TaxID=1337886 RepID=A0ABM9VZL7_9FIRM|nr:ABC transporter substrate-binding protein [Sporomusa sphaeroides]OLS57172.1 vitamin B12-binding protein [Sporomusa sphaeroides DSM 2875]CVK18358.1 corrinoid ABC transporter substrate-binding protein [Sporomusa sphaeroides DSM 2875]